jgi:hypothetical protein
MKKLSLIASMAILANFGLVGCGGGSSAPAAASNNNDSVLSVKGTAIDPELVGATVCLDINGDENCTSVDPSTVTDANGNYTLELTQEQIDGDYPLLVIGGEDKATGEAFQGKLLADLDTLSQNITPLTTLAYEQLQNSTSQADLAESKAQLEALLGLSFEEMQTNIVTRANEGYTRALQVALTLQKSAEALMPENPLGFYDALVQQMETAAPTATLEEMILALTPSALQADMLTFVEETMTTSLDGAYAMADQAKDGAIERGLDFASRMIEMQSGNGFNSDSNTSGQEEGRTPMNPAEGGIGMPIQPGNNFGDSNESQPFMPTIPTGGTDSEGGETPANPTTPSSPTIPTTGF